MVEDLRAKLDSDKASGIAMMIPSERTKKATLGRKIRNVRRRERSTTRKFGNPPQKQGKRVKKKKLSPVNASMKMGEVVFVLKKDAKRSVSRDRENETKREEERKRYI